MANCLKPKKRWGASWALLSSQTICASDGEPWTKSLARPPCARELGYLFLLGSSSGLT
jgi:hypothetical protein